MNGVVFVGAHADDIELGAGGTCAKLCAAGVEVHIVIGTDEADAAVAGARRAEAVAAAKALGVVASRVHFLGLPDGGVRCDRSTVTKVRALLSAKRIRPDLVFTHTEADSHQDHVELTRIVRGAVRNAAIVKYVVRNSGIVSHFTPCIYSAVDAFMPAKTAALCQHRSQVAVGRVDMDVLLNFTRRYAFNLESRHFEAFELEVQEGARSFLDLLDHINDAPFSRLWQPICVRSGITVVTALDRPGDRRGPCAWPHQSHAPSSRAPRELQLVTRLQGELNRMMQGLAVAGSPESLVVTPATGSRLSDLPAGACLLLGGPGINPLARPLLEEIRDLRFQIDIVAGRHGGYPIVDARTGDIYEPAYSNERGGRAEVLRDYGLLTIVRSPTAGTSGSDGVVICAAGIHEAGLAAAFSCLSRMEHVGRIVAEARQVIDGHARAAQWLIPCDAAGQPAIGEVQSAVVLPTAGRGRRAHSRRRTVQQLAIAS